MILIFTAGSSLQCIVHSMSHLFLIVLRIKITVCGDVMPCSLVYVDQRFR
jgi:hypothetical protein